MIDFTNVLSQVKLKINVLEGKLGEEVKDRREYGAISRQYASAVKTVELIEKYVQAWESIKELNMIIQESEDDEMRAMARADLKIMDASQEELAREIQSVLMSKDDRDDKGVILEIRAGTGGDEAALFAAMLFRTYAKYASRRGWLFSAMHISENGIGGYKEARAEISGAGVYSKMKFESGVHRVQRVPETESSGRLHTSTVTVAVLSEVEEIEVKIDPDELRIDVYRSGGPGGQSVNTTDSAVRIVHLPTGLTVIQQDEKSQHKNRAKALKVLRARLSHMYQQQQHDEISKNRKQQIGDGERSERIRTYNFPQSRITDHRADFTAHNILQVINEGLLEELHDALSSYFFYKEFSDILNSQS